MNAVLPRVRKLSGLQADVPFLALCKEIAPQEDAPGDSGPQGLGVGEFQNKYFEGNSMFIDEDLGFYEAMGSRKFSFSNVFKAPWWKPWEVWRELKESQAKLKDRGVEGNMRGIKSKASLLQGGVLVVGPHNQGVTYAHYEENNANVAFPSDEIFEGVKRMVF